MSQIEPKNRNSRLFAITTLIFAILSLYICVILTVLGLIYLQKDSINFPEFGAETGLFSQRTQKDSSKNIDKYITNEVYEPKSDILNIIEKSQSAVVTVVVKAPEGSRLNKRNQSLENRQTLGSGTGFFISDDGLLVTNAHVVCDSSSKDILIITSDEKKYVVDSVAVDTAQDVALLRVNTDDKKVSALKFANPNSEIKVGQEVIAIGNPFGDNPGSVTRGIVSGINRNITAQGSCGNIAQSKDYEGVIQTDAAINSGNSGGPLLNLNGEVIGVNSATLQGANNISYTVPFTSVLKILDRYLKNNNQIISPFLGVTHQMIDPNTAASYGVPSGAFVSRVKSGSAADKAGIKAGDIITKIGDYKISFSLVATLNQHFEPGQKTFVEVYRVPEGEDNLKGQYIKLEIVIGSRTSEQN